MRFPCRSHHCHYHYLLLAEMDRRAAEVAKQNKKPMTFNGVSYGLGDRDFRTKEQKRKELKRQSEMATRIQTRVRGTIARKAYSQKPQAAYHLAIRMQTAFRRIQAQKQLEQLRQQRQHEQVCAVVIHKIVRGRVQWNRYQTTLAVRKTAAVLLQSLVRSTQAQIAYRKQMTAAHDIQVFVTLRLAGWKAKKEVACRRKERAAATAIQTMFRTQAAIAKAQTRRDAVLLLQCAWRRYQAQSELSSMMLEAEFQKSTRHKLQISMATKIQSTWRGSTARSQVAALRAEAAAAKESARQEEIARQEELAGQQELQGSMEKKIQSFWRGSIARSRVATLRAEAAAAEEIARQEEIDRQLEISSRGDRSSSVLHSLMDHDAPKGSEIPRRIVLFGEKRRLENLRWEDHLIRTGLVVSIHFGSRHGPFGPVDGAA
ncbi:hypothetical protein PsorP6_007162 [Peronosclerospora sorghi]|uniref:Uncharacterized protein n=1 Tax=Peronosclerospora sorghi TaxID=230839 RepID=A0ACC0W9G3_9STRA|nr:hypothetical protein PsorP6_007162 [Peronosclerospora sorghi]